MYLDLIQSIRFFYKTFCGKSANRAWVDVPAIASSPWVRLIEWDVGGGVKQMSCRLRFAAPGLWPV